jgi:Fe-S-cluster containining protein
MPRRDGITIPSLDSQMSISFIRELTKTAVAMARTPEVDTFLETHVLPQEFFDLLARFYRDFDAYLEYNLEASDLDVMCGEGCDSCCSQTLSGLYSFETVNLYRVIRQWEDYTVVHNRLAQDSEAFHELLAGLVSDQSGQVRSDDPALPEAREEYAKLGRPCALLQDGNCRVYEHRPIVCRGYHSLTAPKYCGDKNIAENFLFDVPKELDRMLWALSERMEFDGIARWFPQGLVLFAYNVMETKPLPGYELTSKNS